MGNVLHKIREEVIVIEQEREKLVRASASTEQNIGAELEEELVSYLTSLHSHHLMD